MAELADVNGDGFPDLIMATAGPTDLDGLVSGYGEADVYLGDGAGNLRNTWSGQLSAELATIVLGDFDGDGKMDLAAATSRPYNGVGGLDVFLGNGNGTFQPAKQSSSGQVFAGADFNEDGKADLLVLGGSGNGFQVLLASSKGNFFAGASYPIMYAALVRVRGSEQGWAPRFWGSRHA